MLNFMFLELIEIPYTILFQQNLKRNFIILFLRLLTYCTSGCQPTQPRSQNSNILVQTPRSANPGTDSF